MDSAKDFLLDQSKLLSSGELSLAGEAREAGQVVHVPFSPPHPVGGVDVPPAAGAAGAVAPATRTAAGKLRHPFGQSQAPAGLELTGLWQRS